MKRLAIALLLCAPLLLPRACFAQAATAGIAPCAGGTLAVTNSSANTQLSTCGPIVVVYNVTSQEAFYSLGSTSAVTATAQSGSTSAPSTSNSFSIPGNDFVVLNVNTQGWFLAAITAANTTTLRIVQGWATND